MEKNRTSIERAFELAKSGQFVTALLFPLLGKQPAIGRAFSEEEAREGSKVIVQIGRAHV